MEERQEVEHPPARAIAGGFRGGEREKDAPASSYVGYPRVNEILVCPGE